MTRHLFFSWQGDTPNKVGRNFLRAVLENVCKEIATETTLDEAARELTVDSDTKGVAGQPPIVETILKKIDAAAVIVADMTLTGVRRDTRPTPNPNVLIEYGWALKSLGYSRVISVMNTAYGEPSSENLPFDLAHHRWPMQYSLPEDATPDVIADEKRRLTRDLKKAVIESLATLPTSAIAASPAFSEAPAKDGPARFRAPGEELGLDEDFGGRQVFLSQGPAMWLRLMPTTTPHKRWTTRELLQRGQENSNLSSLRLVPGGYSYVRASDGHGVYRVRGAETEADQRRTTDSVTFAFRTGEVWSVDVAYLAYDEKQIFYSEIEETFVKAAGRYRQFLKSLGIPGPYRWIAGLIGAKGRHLAYPPRPGYSWLGMAGPICAVDRIEASGMLADEQSPLEALRPFFDQIFEECGIERPDYVSTLSTA